MKPTILSSQEKEALAKNNYAELRKSFSKLKISSDDINGIAVAFQEFLFVRHEEITDYPNMEEWADYWRTHGYSKNQIIEMIDHAKELPKFRKGQLAIGDLITHWRKNKEETLGISWHEFSTALKKLLESDKELIDKYSRETTGLPFIKAAERNDIKEYLQLIKQRTEAELASCQLTRKITAAELIDKAQAFHKIDHMITYEVILAMRQMIYELEHTTRQPLRVMRSNLEELEKYYQAYHSANYMTHTQELGAAALKAVRILRGYDENFVKDLTEIEEVLIKYNLLQPEYK